MELDGLQELAAERQRREDFFEKSFDPTYIEKGKRAQLGETRDWKDGTYKKTKDGWVPFPKGGGSKGGDEPKTLSEFRDYLIKQGEKSGDKELVEYAKKASSDNLKKRYQSFKLGGEGVGTASEKVKKVAEYMKKHGMSPTTNQVNSAADGTDSILSSKEIEEVKRELSEGGGGDDGGDEPKTLSDEDYDKEWVESFLKKVRSALHGVTLTPSRGDASRFEKVKKIIQNMDDFPYYEGEAVERELKKLGFDIHGDRLTGNS